MSNKQLFAEDEWGIGYQVVDEGNGSYSLHTGHSAHEQKLETVRVSALDTDKDTPKLLVEYDEQPEGAHPAEIERPEMQVEIPLKLYKFDGIRLLRNHIDAFIPDDYDRGFHTLNRLAAAFKISAERAVDDNSRKELQGCHELLSVMAELEMPASLREEKGWKALLHEVISMNAHDFSVEGLYGSLAPLELANGTDELGSFTSAQDMHQLTPVRPSYVDAVTFEREPHISSNSPKYEHGFGGTYHTRYVLAELYHIRPVTKLGPKPYLGGRRADGEPNPPKLGPRTIIDVHPLVAAERDLEALGGKAPDDPGRFGVS